MVKHVLRNGVMLESINGHVVDGENLVYGIFGGNYEAENQKRNPVDADKDRGAGAHDLGLLR